MEMTQVQLDQPKHIATSSLVCCADSDASESGISMLLAAGTMLYTHKHMHNVIHVCYTVCCPHAGLA